MSAETPTAKRRYEKRERAAQEQATRMRIIDAAIALHGTIGPARTTISAIAAGAGVRRATVYRHFPDERALFMGCAGTFEERNPVPNPVAWAPIADPRARLAAALDAVYEWYEQVEPLLTAVSRDAEAMPIVAEIEGRRLAYLAAVEDGLVAGWGVRGNAARRLRATIGLALDFHTWRTLHRRGLTRADAIGVMASAVEAATQLSRRPTGYR